MTLFHWSRVAASNGAADVTCPFPEGMGAPALNDGARGMMAAVAKYRDDIAGAIVTTGNLNSYSVLSYQGFDSLADMNGQEIAFSPHATNGNTVVLNVDFLGAKPLRTAPGVELMAGTLVLGTPYMALYNNTDGAFYLKGYYSGPFDVPFLGGMDLWDTVAPNSGFIFPQGQAISRTVYSRAFAKWGTKFGVGDGATTFNVPDKTGRVSAMQEVTATRLTTAGSGVDGSAFGAAGGAETHTLTTPNLPPYTPSGANGVPGYTDPTVFFGGVSGGASATAYFANNINASGQQQVGNPTHGSVTAPSFTGTPQGGTSTPLPTITPLIVVPYVIRIL